MNNDIAISLYEEDLINGKGYRISSVCLSFLTALYLWIHVLEVMGASDSFSFIFFSLNFLPLIFFDRENNLFPVIHKNVLNFNYLWTFRCLAAYDIPQIKKMEHHAVVTRFQFRTFKILCHCHIQTRGRTISLVLHTEEISINFHLSWSSLSYGT